LVNTILKKMKYILTILITLFAVQAIAQPTPTYTGSNTQMSYNRGSVGALRLQYIPRGFYPFPTFDTLGTIWVDSAQTRGLFYHNGAVRLRLASVPYVDSIAASIEAGSVDSSIYSTVTRLSDSLHSLRDYVDSNNTIIYGSIARIDSTDSVFYYQIAELQSDVPLIDSALGVAFGAISTLYDTLPNYVDTAMLNDSLQAIKAAYVPYTGATGNVNLGSKSITTNKVLADTLGAKSSMGIHLHGTGGKGIMVGAGGGGTITFDDYPTTTTGDSVLSTNSSGGLLRYNLKGKLANYWLKTDTGRAATNIVTGGALNKVRDSLAALSGGGSSTLIKANEFNMLYKANGDTTIRGTTKVRVDTTDSRMEFAFDTTTSTVTTDPHGGVKMWGSNRMGMGAVRINDTVSIPAALQRAINTQITSTMLPTVTGNIAYTNNYVYTGMVQPAGTLGYIAAAWNSTIQHFNYNKTTFTTASGANSSSLIRIGSISQSAGIICGNTKFSGGGGRGTFTFSFPTYLSTQRIMIGYSEAVAALTGDPSTFLTTPTPYSSLMVIKDAADTTLQFAHYSGTGVVTKVNTGIKPNNEDVYRLTVYIAPNSTYYMQLEVISKTAAVRVVTLNPTTNVPPVGDRLVQQQAVNNGTVGGVVVYGLIQHLEEIY
jgi:hypothetical protein